MPELLITRAQDVKVLETTVKELKIEIPSVTDAVAKASNIVTNNMGFDFATKKAATKWIKQAVAEPIMARLEKLQARLDEITRKRDGIKKDVSDRDTRMKRGDLCR